MKVKIMILSTRQAWKTLFLSILGAVFFLSVSCTHQDRPIKQELNPYRSLLEGAFTIPSNGSIRLYAHHDTLPWIMAINHSTSEIFIFDYISSEIILQCDYTSDEQWNPGSLYSLGFYREGYYLLGANGLFVFDNKKGPVKAWRNKMGRYGEYGVVPSFIIQQDGKEYLVARYQGFYLPQGMKEQSFYDNIHNYRFLALFSLDKDADDIEISYFAGYPEEAEIAKKIPSNGIKFTVYQGIVNVLFSSEQVVWQYPEVVHQPEYFEGKPFYLRDGENNYLLDGPQEINPWRLFAENPNYDLLHVDRATGDHYLEYTAPLDEEYWVKVRNLKNSWMDQYYNEVVQSRMVKFDQSFNPIYEISTSTEENIGWIQLVHDGKFFVSGTDEPEFGQEFQIYTIEVESRD